MIWSLLLALCASLVLLGLAVDPTADARANVEAVAGDQVELRLREGEEPSVWRVRWPTTVEEGDVVDVDLVGPCRCEPVPAEAEVVRFYVLAGAGLVVLLATIVGCIRLLVRSARRVHAHRRAGRVQRGPHEVAAVHLRPRWVRRGLRLQPHLDLIERSTGELLGAVALERVSAAFDPGAPYVAQRQGDAVALVSEDGRHLVLPSSRLLLPSRVPEEAPASAAATAAIGWDGADPAHGAAFDAAAQRQAIATLVVVLTFVFALVVGLSAGGGLLATPVAAVGVVVVGRLIARWVRRPVQDYVRTRIGASRRTASRAAVAAMTTLVPVTSNAWSRAQPPQLSAGG